MTVQLDGYEILGQIYESANSAVYRGVRQQDSQAVILKVLKEDYPTPSELTRYKHEYEITRNLNVEGAVRAYSTEPYQRTLAIVLEDFGASSLKQLMSEARAGGESRAFSVGEFLSIAIKTTEILVSVHAAGVIHKDINPSNIVLNPKTGQVKLIDFGISTTFSRENPTLKNPNVLEGTLAYISPEQTGRMNRSLDYRTDFYSLGVTFYELLAGQLPFESSDALELVHCHIAKVPVAPHRVNPEIPKVLSDLVLKLMAKTAEERYQSAFGIKADLEKCLNQLQAGGNITDFLLGTQDISDKFKIPQKLYGRETEVNTLLAAFERVANPDRPKSEMMLVAGYSGIGKSALVQELYKPITEKRGYFISGKFDQFQRNVPYSAIVSAFKGLVRQLLTETEDQLRQWREKLLAAFGPNGQVITDVIPEVELIVGKQPPVPELGLSESQNRFNLVFQNFIRAFASKEHPLVIFLDDLQWADLGTLKLIELTVADADTQYLFLIGAYRDSEVSPAHPLMMALDRLQKQGATVNFIALAPLQLEPIIGLIAGTLHRHTDEVQPLAELVSRKTGGNPFFVRQFLKALHAETLIVFDYKRQGWQWDMAQIEAQNITDNVVELLVRKLRKLPESAQQVLRLAACAGASFDLNTLSLICEKSKQVIFPDLVTAIQSGLILPVSDLDENLLIQDYRFAHDRIQQAAYALIEESQKKPAHLQIGRLLLQETAPETLAEKVFEIADHLNEGAEFVDSRQEREEIAKLNLMASQKAKASAAYGAALQYLKAGLELLSADSWQRAYDLTLALYAEGAEAAYLSGDFEGMERLALAVQNSAKTVLDKVKVYQVKIQAAAAQGNLKEAVKIGLQALNLLGVILPEEPSPLDIEKGLEETASLLDRHEIETLIDLPVMRDPEKLAAMLLLSSIASAAFIATPELFLLIAAAKVNLSVQYGNAELSAFAYVQYTVVLWKRFQDIESAYKFGKLAVSLADKLNAQKVKAKIGLGFGAHTMHWKDHFKETVPILIEGYQSGVETWDFEYAGYCACYLCEHLYFLGNELADLEQRIATYSKAIHRIRQEAPLNWTAIFRQATLNLLGQAENPIRLFGDAYSEERSLPLAIAANDRIELLFFYSNKLILCYLFGENRQAVENAAIAQQYTEGLSTMLVTGLLNFYDSLAHLSAWGDASNPEQVAWLDRVNASQEKMQQWAHHAPMNYAHKFYLVEAERARVLGKVLEAEEFYERAIQGAASNGFIQEEALAYELAAKFYLERSRLKIAQTYMKEAHYAYRRWGAKAKVEDLEAKYPQLLPKSSAPKILTYTPTTATHSTTGSQSGETLDLATVMKASQAISGEIVLNKLLANLMKILIQNAGAQIGHLILETGGELRIEASGEVDSDRLTVLQSLPLDSRLPTALINYVFRTKETVVLNDASQEGQFTHAPYIKQHKTKSLLCAPLLDRGELTGIVYLENNLTAGAFTPNRLEVLQLLSGQAAISIENARLYQTLDDKVKERTAQLAKANQEITALNELLKEENLRMRAELEVTRQLQQMILPKPEELSSVEGLDIAGFMEPADEVGGDYYDVLHQDGRVKIGIGDVTGHGLESGVLMLMTQTAVRTLQESNQSDPVKFLDILNRTIYANVQRINPYRNLTLALLDYAEGTLSVSGQHEEIIIVRAGGELERLDTRALGFPIGLEEEIADFISSEQVRLKAGDVVVLYTDGITEAFNMERQQYGLERLCEVVRRNCSRPAEGIREAIVEDVRRHIGEQKVFDDLTLVVLKQK